MFLGPLLDIEENEKREFDNINAKSRKKRKVDASSNPCAVEAEVVQNLTEDNSSEKNLFHKKTRIIEQSTPEALILNLYFGSPCLLIKADEFAVR